MLEKSRSLAGKRLLVTGAASGMGREFAMLAAGDGAVVAALDKNAEGLEVLHTESQAGQVTPVVVDLGDWSDVERAIAEAVEVIGGLDAVCNVAGWDSPGPFWEQPLELWERIVRINLWSVIHVCRATVPILMDQGAGRIVNTASDAGRVGSKGETIYAAAKAGVIGLTKSLAREVASYGITVNCLCPGPTNTALFQAEAADNPRLMEKLVKAIPLRRIAEPSDQANVLAFFASDAASYMTGQVVSVSGGLTMVG